MKLVNNSDSINNENINSNIKQTNKLEDKLWNAVWLLKNGNLTLNNLIFKIGMNKSITDIQQSAISQLIDIINSLSQNDLNIIVKYKCSKR